jgi:hypothetical protein
MPEEVNTGQNRIKVHLSIVWIFTWNDVKKYHNYPDLLPFIRIIVSIGTLSRKAAG